MVCSFVGRQTAFVLALTLILKLLQLLQIFCLSRLAIFTEFSHLKSSISVQRWSVYICCCCIFTVIFCLNLELTDEACLVPKCLQPCTLVNCHYFEFFLVQNCRARLLGYRWVWDGVLRSVYPLCDSFIHFKYFLTCKWTNILSSNDLLRWPFP